MKYKNTTLKIIKFEMPQHKKSIKTEIEGEHVLHTNLYQKLCFKRFLKSFDFIKNCDSFWEIQRRF